MIHPESSRNRAPSFDRTSPGTGTSSLFSSGQALKYGGFWKHMLTIENDGFSHGLTVFKHEQMVVDGSWKMLGNDGFDPWTTKEHGDMVDEPT